MKKQLTFICISCDYKGGEFLRALHEEGHKVFLVSSQKTEDKPWPRECLEDIYFMPENDGRHWNMDTLIAGTAYIFSQNQVDKIIALDDYDVKKVAMLREEFRSPGMGETTARHFYDKLAMRMIARENKIRIPDFSPLFNDEVIQRFLDSSKGPWFVKPRSDAGAIGIRKINSAKEFWAWNNENKEKRHTYLIECFTPGHVYHVDTLFTDYKPLFTRSSRYLQPPFEIAHGGGVFRSQSLDAKSKESKELAKLNTKLLEAFGLKFGASHSEFIKSSEDGKFYFLETSARVGGAHLADMVEAASGVNLWAEWARIESAMLLNQSYSPPKPQNSNAGIIATLSRFEDMDYSLLDHPSICWTLNKKYHVGLIMKDDSSKKVTELLDEFTSRIYKDFHSSVPLKE
jgi:biotin carboxylase